MQKPPILAAELKKLGGAHLVLAIAPNSKAVSALINALATDGQDIIVTWSNEPVQISSWQLLGNRRSVTGWTGCPARNSSEETLQFSVIAGIVTLGRSFPVGTGCPGL